MQVQTASEPPKRPQRTRDAIQVLFERGVISSDETRAALEIRRIWAVLTAGLFAKAIDLDGVRGKSGNDWPRGLEHAYLTRYRPWANEMSLKRTIGGPTFLSVVFDAVVDERTLRDIDADNRWNDKAAGYLVEALQRYATLARWRTAA